MLIPEKIKKILLNKQLYSITNTKPNDKTFKNNEYIKHTITEIRNLYKLISEHCKYLNVKLKEKTVSEAIDSIYQSQFIDTKNF